MSSGIDTATDDHVAVADDCAIYVDMGTTNTRVWLMLGNRIIAQAAEPVGVRDAARGGSSEGIRIALRELIAEVRTKAVSRGPSCIPQVVVAAGMIGSPIGLVDVPHVSAPAGIEELAASAAWLDLTDVTDLPILLVPGVRTGPLIPSVDGIHESDVMRGEETLCVGLAALGLVAPPIVVLNIGSHWKAIHLNEDGKIQSSRTSLSGELLYAAQTQTVLASSVGGERPHQITGRWTDAGMREQRRSGLARALFCVRLLELGGQGTPEERLAFLVGAFIAADLDALLAQGVIGRNVKVAIVGTLAMAEAWRSALSQVEVSAVVITPADSERALLTGLRGILQHSRQAVARGGRAANS